jgi:archaellum biogenesis ATPase FlaH
MNLTKEDSFVFWNCMTYGTLSKKEDLNLSLTYSSIIEESKSKEQPKCLKTFNKNQLESLLNSLLIESFEENKPDLIIIDQINPLFYLEDENKSIFEFIQELISLTKYKDTTVIIMMHENLEDVDEKNIMRYMEYNSDIMFQINPLSSGYSKDVHGEVLY